VVLSLRITVLGFLLAFALAALAALARDSRSRIARFVAACYVEVIRNTPVLLQIFIVFFELPTFGIRLSAVTAGTIALGINVGAYLTEVLRAGVSAVAEGQLEAAQILGLSRSQTFGWVVLPQTARIALPPLVVQYISLIKDTSIASVIGLVEIMKAGQSIVDRTGDPVSIYLTVAVFYFVLCYPLSAWVTRTQRKVRHQ